MNLIVVESPTKARTLKRFLGDEYLLEATMGHIKDLPKQRLSVDIEKDFEPQYVVIEKKKESIEKIKKEAKKAKQVYIATDPDREGEAIAQHVYEILKLDMGNGKLDNEVGSGKSKKSNLSPQNPVSNFSLPTSISRIVFHEITKDAVEKAMAHTRGIDKNLVEAQIARRVLDRLVGYKISPLLWKKVRRGLSAGRVQSVAVRLIVEREREIEAFVPQEFWEIYCQVKGKRQEVKDQEFVVKLVKIGEKKAEIGNKDEADKVVADLEKSDYKVFDVKSREVRKRPYAPFTTSTMTQTAARFYGWSAKKTMSIAQRLYEEGLITYHRTDSTSLSSQAVSKARDYIEKNYGGNYLPETPRIYKTKSKVAQEAHEAIRPTDISSKFEVRNPKFAKDGETLYKLIWKRFVACQMADSIYDETVIDVQVLGTRQKAIEKKTSAESLVSNAYLLRASGQIMKFDGWRKVIPPRKDDKLQLPKVEKDEALDLLKVDPQQKFTQPSARYNEASLIKTLEKLGIGRPSTYAPTISTIQVRQYVEKEEGRFKPTNVGVAVNDFLIKNFPDIFDYQFTAEMEDDLDNVAKGEREWRTMIKGFYTPFERKLDEVTEKSERVKIETEKLGRKCPACEKEGRTGEKQGELVIRTGRFGKFISCSNFPECKHTEKYVEKIGMTCPKCKKGEVIVKTTRKGRKFYGCSRYPDCDFASWKKPASSKPKQAPINDY